MTSEDNPKTSDPTWERQFIERLATASLNEQKRARRWGVLFKLLTFTYLFVLLALWFPDNLPQLLEEATDKHTAIVDIKGVIAPGEPAGAKNVIKGLKAAFEDDNTQGVILRINSPGGSPVQSSLIYNEIDRLQKKHEDIPVYAVVEDVCASGGYFIASAADEIYVNESSIVGSIGVIMSTFGFVDTLDKLGVERRLMTAGEHKGILDPFSPLQDFDRDHAQDLLDRIHEDFIAAVKQGRGDRLVEDEQTYSGLFWTGRDGVERGLADGFGDTGHVARELIKAKKLVNFTPREDVLERLTSRLGSSIGRALHQELSMAQGFALQ